MAPENSGKIEFIENHKPSIPTGNYTLSVKQVIKADKITKDNEFSATLNFSVLGPRFTLDPQEIQAVFPPDGSLGDHANVLPHIILKRSTLPWERQSDRNREDTPWLALLLFDEDDLKTKVEEDDLKTKVEINSIKLSELMQPSDKFSQYVEEKATPPSDRPYWKQELGDHKDDSLTVIDVDKTLLQAIIPTQDDLKLLAHVRQTKDATDKLESEAVVLICNRLPQSGQMSTVHLVSLEERYQDDQFDFRHLGDRVRLVSLTSWRFACIDKRQSFKGLLMHLNHQLLFNIEDDGISNALNQQQIPDPLKQAFIQNQHPLEASIQVDRIQWKITDNTHTYLISNTFNVYNQAGRKLFQLDAAPTNIDRLKDKFQQNNHALTDRAAINPISLAETDHWWLNTDDYLIAKESDRLSVYHLDPDSSSTLRLPPLKSSEQPTVQNAAESYLKMGCVPLSHAMREGNKSISWYHSPLVPGDYPPQDIPLPVRSADDLVRYNPSYGMFDVSYAAAWELGRLLALQSKSFSVSLYQWKRTHAQKIKDAEQQLDHLPLDGPSAFLELPQAVSSWFEHLALLEGVPFNYLVPDERLLPTESIRFFQIDPMWMECLMDGAFSIGRVLATDHEHDRRHRDEDSVSVNVRPVEQISGFLLRSDVVAGWPGLLVDGYSEVFSDANLIPDKVALFELELKNRDSLNAKDIKALQSAFTTANQNVLSQNIKKITIENIRWSVSTATEKYDLIKRENNEIDVCAPNKYQFSIDASFETNLNIGSLSPDLLQVFQNKITDFSSKADLSVIGWFLTDGETKKYYLIQEEGTKLQVYQMKKLPLLRMASLSKNVLICLFDGIVKTIDLHLKPETLHFGLDSDDGKENRAGSKTFLPSDSSLWQKHSKRILKITELAKKLCSTVNSAQFAVEMIEGVEKVRFTINSNN